MVSYKMMHAFRLLASKLISMVSPLRALPTSLVRCEQCGSDTGHGFAQKNKQKRGRHGRGK